jgi:hypothetical protein
VQFAGRHEDDVWEQMQEHIPHLDQIYFAGGEPLIMEEHNRILKLLIEKGNTRVKLIYNTNLNDLRYKKESVLDLWKHFPDVCVAASLDDMGDRAEVIRSGTDWAKVEQNIRDLKRECPHIDFMISPTLSMMNIWNFTRFHRYMVESGFIEPKDLNVNILQGPEAYRIDLLPGDLKAKFKQEFEQHIEWLEPLDTIQRAVGGFKGAIEFMMATDNSHLLGKFWTLVEDLDGVRNESLTAVVPELEQIAQYKTYDLKADQQKTFVENYNNVADPKWPKIFTIEQFDQLPVDIQQKATELQTLDAETIQHNTTIDSYNNVADATWPKISTIEQYNALPEEIKQKAVELQTLDAETIQHNTTVDSYNNVADPAWPTVTTIEQYNALPDSIRAKAIELQTATADAIAATTFVDSYNNVADPAWPKIATVQEFYDLPAWIQKELIETFNIVPPTT